jgi:hypothetical protein
MPSPMLQMSLDLLVHGLQHFVNGDSLDLRLAILHIDQSVELALKERVRAGRRQVMKPGGKESISIYDAYKILDELGVFIPERPNLDLLHEQRNQIQHLFSSPDNNAVRFHIDNALFFLARFLSDEFALLLLDFIPDEIMSNDKLKHLENIDKLRALYESAESSYKAGKAQEGISALLAVIDLTLQFHAERKSVQLSGTNTKELLSKAETKKILTKRACESGKKILEINQQTQTNNYPSEADFLSIVAKFRSETQDL